MSSLLLSFYMFPIIALDRNNFKYNARETVILVGTTIFWWPVLFQRRRYE